MGTDISMVAINKTRYRISHHEANYLQQMVMVMPRSLDTISESSAHLLVEIYCELYNLYACSELLFNHENPLRPKRIVVQHINQAAKRICQYNEGRLTPMVPSAITQVQFNAVRVRLSKYGYDYGKFRYVGHVYEQYRSSIRVTEHNMAGAYR